MHIVVLDDFDLGSHNLGRLAEHGEVRVYEGVPANDDELVARASDAEVALCCWTRVGSTALEMLPRLRMLSLAATGTDTVDVRAATRRGVVVCRVPAYATNAVAELTLGLMLAVARKIPAADRSCSSTAMSASSIAIRVSSARISLRREITPGALVAAPPTDTPCGLSNWPSIVA